MKLPPAWLLFYQMILEKNTWISVIIIVIHGEILCFSVWRTSHWKVLKNFQRYVNGLKKLIILQLKKYGIRELS